MTLEPLIYLRLLEVGVHLNLVNSRLDFSVTKHIPHNWDSAVADTNTLSHVLLNKLFHLTPNNVKSWAGWNTTLFPVNRWTHPMNEVQVNVVKLQLGKTSLQSSLDIVLVGVPQLGGDEKFLSLDSSLESFLKSSANLFLIPIDHSGVDVTISSIDNGLVDDFLDIVISGGEESTKTNNRHVVTTGELDSLLVSILLFSDHG